MTEWMTPDEALQQAYGANPLLEALGPHLDFETLAERLRQRPLDDIPWWCVRPSERQAFLPQIENHFVTTRIALDAAQNFQALIRQHYLRRNPLCQRTRMQLDWIANYQGATIPDRLWFNGGAGAMTLSGITGVGKSVTQDRVLSLFPQTVLHGPNPAAGWLQLNQLVYLRVQMSSDSSRAGFLTQILAEVDAALDTDYHAQYAKNSKWTVEKLMVQVGKILSRHYCGALIIEEIQERNFAGGAPSDLLLLFFLRLLNFGIPIVLIGNPRGFRAFESFSQDVRRFSSYGRHDFWPSDAVDDAGWDKFYLPGLSEFHLLDKPFDWTPTAKAAAIHGSGGVPSFMATLWRVCQRNALQAGRHEISEADLEVAANDAALAPQRALIDALRRQDVTALTAFKDIPYEDFASRWAPHRTPSTVSEQARKKPGADVSTVVPGYLSGERRLKAKTTRAATRAAKTKVTYSEDDLRNEAARQSLLDGLADQRDSTLAVVPASASQKESA